MLDDVRQSVLVATGLLCALVFSVNAGVLLWLIFRKRDQGIARCPRCGRKIVCPHCAAEDQPPDPAS